MPDSVRPLRSTVAIVPVFVTAAILAAVGPRPGEILRAAGHPQRYVDVSGADSAAVLVIGLAGWAVLAWLVVGVGAVAATRLPGAAGAMSQAIAERTLPGVLRRATAAALGISVVAGTGHGLVGSAGAIGPPATAQPAAVMAHAGPAEAAATIPGAVHRAAPAAESIAAVGSAPALTGVDWPVGPLERVPVVAPDFRAAAAGPRGIDWPATTPTKSATVDVTVTVRPGDCLWDIAAAHLPATATAEEIAAAWPRWYAANRSVIGSDPSLIYPGQVFVSPDRQQ